MSNNNPESDPTSDANSVTPPVGDTPVTPAAAAAPAAPAAPAEPVAVPVAAPAAPAAPAYAAPAAPVGVPVAVKKGLAIAALIVGIVAFVSGWIPVWGIILGIVGLVLGIIALVKKQPKALALTGTILAALGLITSLITTIIAGAVTSAVVDVIDNGTSVTVETPEGSDYDADSNDAGSQSNPLPMSSLIVSDEWEVKINSVTLDATADVVAASPLNTAPTAGTQYAVINATFTNVGDISNTPLFVAIEYVTSGGEVISSLDSIVVAPEPSVGISEVLAGGTLTGNVALEIPANDQGMLRVTPGLFANEVFVEIK